MPVSNHAGFETVFEQRWLHARHVENERLFVLNVYAVLYGAVAYSLGVHIYDQDAWPIHIFLIIFAVFEILFSIKADLVFYVNVQYAEHLLEEPFRLPDNLPDTHKHWVHKIRLSRLFPTFYLIFLEFSFFCILAPHIHTSFAGLVALVTFVGSCAALWRFHYPTIKPKF